MNQNPHTGPAHPASMQNAHQSRRHQEYHQYQQHAAPQSPGPHNPYAYPYPPQYYAPAMHMPFQYQRWTPQQHYQQPFQQPYPPVYPSYAPQHVPIYSGPRSPMSGSSTSHMAPYAQGPRQTPYSPNALPAPSSYTAPVSHSPAVSHAISSPREPPSHTSTPQPPSRRLSEAAPPITLQRPPFSPPLPWYSSSGGAESFPPRAPRLRRKRKLYRVTASLYLPVRGLGEDASARDNEATSPADDGPQAQPNPISESDVAMDGHQFSRFHAAQHASGARRPSLSALNIAEEVHPPHTVKSTIPVRPALPQVAIPRTKPTPVQENGTGSISERESATLAAANHEIGDGVDAILEPTASSSSHVKAQPKSWADLVRSKGAADAAGSPNTGMVPNGSSSRNGTIGEVLNAFDVEQHHKIAFLEPRGLVNTGNMCYMNSILQVLVFCIPFYYFLDQVGKRAAHSFKSDTPLVDAIIMFMREYRVIDSADSVEKLRLRLKDNELEQYGEPLIPEYVYSMINTLPRFSSMRRGHQQDAEEFLGFLLAGLHDECLAVIKAPGAAPPTSDHPSSPVSTSSHNADGWLEVGPKQRAAITRQAGDPSASSPVTRIFGGALRSELRVPGLKNSVTLEPYQPLQLDIGAPGINNITDALKGLTRPESLTGDFHSPRGPGTSATKQVFIESLPPVLILHLKRFQYDSSGGTQKIWKRIGYPLQLEMPKEVFPPAKRASMALQGGLPKYRLVSVVYHHGRSAAGGHYTTDILRQDRREWIRIDDTFIRRIRSEQVAEAGADEDPKVLAKALERHQAETELSAQRNTYEGLDAEQDNEDGDKAWNDVNGGEAKRRWAGVAGSGGSATPSSMAGKGTPQKDGVRDNKVAYILLYERVLA